MASKKVMVVLEDQGLVGELTDLACQLATGMEADLIMLHVVQVPIATPLGAPNEILDEEGQKILAMAAKLAEGKVPAAVSTQLVRARNASEAIISEAGEQDVDLLVIGHPRQHELSEFLLGSTARYVAHHAPCRVIVQIPAPSTPKAQAVLVTGPVLASC